MRRCADALRTGQGALARLEALETGRPIRATAADLSEAIADFEDAAGAALDMRRVRIELAGGRVEERRSARGRVVDRLRAAVARERGLADRRRQHFHAALPANA